MNSLTRYIRTAGLDEKRTLEILQGEGVVSDNAIAVEDVAEWDCAAAITFLSLRATQGQMEMQLV